MASLIAALNLALILITSLLQGELRYFDVNTKKGIAPLAVTFNATSIYNAKLGQKFIWTFGNGETLTTTSATTVYAYRVAGTYTAKLKYLKNATDAVSKAVDGGSATIVVQPGVVTNTPPVPQLACASNVVGKVECNAAGSVDNNGTIVSYKYEWGDSAVDTKTDTGAIVHAYSTTGSKTIKLTVTDNAGAIASISKTVQVKENLPPVAAMTCTTTNMTTNCNATASTDPDGQALSYSFNFGDGAVVSSTNGLATHTYTVAANYQIKVTVTDTFGATAIAAAQASPSQPTPPRGYFNYEQDGTFITLKAFIRKTQYEIAKAYYVIDGNQNNKIQLSNFYSNAINYVEMNTFGNHNITMYVEDMAGQKYETSIGIYILDDVKYMKPYLRFFGNQSGPRKMYYHLGRSFIPLKNEIIKNFKIDFGDGQSANLVDTAAINHTYAAAGTYNVKVEAEYKGNVQSSTFSMVVTNDDILQIPVAEFQYLIHDFAGNVTFADERSGTPNGEIISYVWDYGDGTIGYGKKAVHFFTAPGVYLVKLTVTDTMGLSNSMTQQVTVVGDDGDIVAGLNCASIGSLQGECRIYAVDSLNEIVRVKLDWGDGNSNTLNGAAIPEWGYYIKEHTYQNPGDYNVNLVIDTARGMSKYSTALLQFFPVMTTPIASIYCTSVNMQVFCNGLGSYDPGGGPLTYTVNWGDGVIEEYIYPYFNHTYTEPRYYNPKLTVKNNMNNTADGYTSVLAIREVEINQKPTAVISCLSPRPYTIECFGNASADTDGHIVSYEYFYEDGYVDFKSSTNSSIRSFNHDGSTTVKLVVTDDDGAKSEVIQSFILSGNTSPIIESINCYSESPFQINCGANAYDLDPSDQIINYSWKIGGTNIVREGLLLNSIVHTYDSFGTYKVILTVTDQYGASVSAEKEITVLDNQPPTASVTCSRYSSTDPDLIGCSGSATDVDGTIKESYITIDGKKYPSSFGFRNFNGGETIVHFTAIDNYGKIATAQYTVVVDWPRLEFNCELTRPYHMSCKILNLPGENVLAYGFKIDESDMIKGKNLEYDFDMSGEATIEAIAIAGDKEVVATNGFIIPETYLPPKPNFISHVDKNNVVKFDAIESYMQDRKIASFKWEFGDSGIQTVFSEKVSHAFAENKNYEVKLTTVDRLGNSDTIVKTVFVYKQDVVDPGPVNDQTVAGIDSDNNQVRDDIQRWIAYEAKDNGDLKYLLERLAASYQVQITNSSNKILLNSQEQQQIDLKSCISGRINEDNLSQYYFRMIEHFFSTTELRSAELVKVQQNLWTGKVKEAIPDDMSERLQKCYGI